MIKKPTVLFIDDDLSTRRVYASKLAMSGFPTHIVSSPEEAVVILEKEGAVDVIITDLMMPNFDGVDLIKAVRECAYTRHIPILAFTTGGNIDLMEKAAMSGANEIIQKYSCPPATLVAKVMEVYQQSLQQ